MKAGYDTHDQRSGICQSISGLPAARRAWLVRENGRLPKNPRRADNGEGWAELMMTCRSVSISSVFFCA
jgi:hypothetical protein